MGQEVSQAMMENQELLDPLEQKATKVRKESKVKNKQILRRLFPSAKKYCLNTQRRVLSGGTSVTWFFEFVLFRLDQRLGVEKMGNQRLLDHAALPFLSRCILNF